MLKLSERNKEYLKEISVMDIPLELSLIDSRENEGIEDKEKLLDELFDDYHKEKLREKQKELQRTVVLAEKENNEPLLNTALEEYGAVSKKLNNINK